MKNKCTAVEHVGQDWKQRAEGERSRVFEVRVFIRLQFLVLIVLNYDSSAFILKNKTLPLTRKALSSDVPKKICCGYVKRQNNRPPSISS